MKKKNKKKNWKDFNAPGSMTLAYKDWTFCLLYNTKPNKTYR